jgi:predicted nicotinamide N-methyase
VTNVIPNLANPNSSGIGDLQEARVKILGTDQTFAISMPTDFDRLLDLAQDDPEQNLPYWAELWPSGIALAAHIVNYPGELRGIQAVELGCGLGVTATAAMRRGIRLIATDYAPEALALCAMNCAANDVPAPTLRQMNWRKPDPDFLTAASNRIPLLLAADALYEERDIEPLLHLVQSNLSADGELWLAEPGRRPAARFVERISALGWRSSKTSYDGPWPDPVDNRKGVVVTVHRMTRSF